MTTLAQRFLASLEYPYLAGRIVEIQKFEAVAFWDDTNQVSRLAIAIDNADDITRAILALFERITHDLLYSLERTDDEQSAQYYDGEGRSYQDKYPCGYSGSLIVSLYTKLPKLGTNGDMGDFPIFVNIEEDNIFVRLELEDLKKVKSWVSGN